MMLVLWCGFLLLAHFLCHVHPQKCDTKYEYKQKNIIQCCNKCGPGERMKQRCTNDSPTLCKQCGPDFYMDEYSTEMECKRCSQCTKDYMVYKVSCSNSTDAVCDCESGYKCNDKSCTQCEKIPTSPPPTTTTTASNTTKTTMTSSVMPIILSHDTLWITLSLCCVCILLNCFILISRHTPACGRIMLASTGSFGGPRKHQLNPVSAQKMRKCQCQSKRCVDRRNGKKRSEGNRGKRREQGRKRRIRVWIDYVL